MNHHHAPGDDLAQTDLVWMATRYLLDELDMAERAAFEERLASDERAPLALAEAVELHAALRLYGAEETLASVAGQGAMLAPARRTEWLDGVGRPAVGWIAVGVAACLAVMLVGRLAPSGQDASASASSVDQLAIAWAQTTSEQGVPFDALTSDDSNADDELDLDGQSLAALDLPVDHATTPSWMYAAVEARRAASRNP